MGKGRFSSAVGLTIDALTGFAALGVVVAVVFFSHSQQDIRPFVLSTAGAYFAAGFLRGARSPIVFVQKPVAIALGGILPIATISIGGLAPKLQVLIVSFMAVSLLWAIAGAATRQFAGKHKHKQALAVAGVSTLGIFSVVLFMLPTWMDARATTWTNRSLQPFSITTLDGQTLRSEDLRGHIVVVVFWATWCPPCQVELPQIARLESKYRARTDVLVIALDAKTGGDTAEKARAFLSRTHLNLTAAIDNPINGQPDGKGQAGRSMGLYDLPTLYVLDRQGHLRVIYNGYDSSENLVGSLSRAINLLTRR